MLFEVLSILLLPGLSLCDQLLGVQCEADPLGYVVPDPKFCDRYLECSPAGQGSIQLCPSGHGLDLNTGICLPLDKIDCDIRGATYRTTPSPIVPKIFHPKTTTRLLQPKSTTTTITTTFSRDLSTQATAGLPKSPSSRGFGIGGSVRNENIVPTSKSTANEESEGSRKLSVNLNSRGSLITSDSPATAFSEPSRGTAENLASSTNHRNSFFGGRDRASSISSIAPTTTSEPLFRGSASIAFDEKLDKPSFSIFGSSRGPSSQTQSSRESQMDLENPTEELKKPFGIFGSSRGSHLQQASDNKVEKLLDGAMNLKPKIFGSSRSVPTHLNVETEAVKPSDESTKSRPRISIFGSPRGSNVDIATKIDPVSGNSKVASSVAAKLFEKSKRQRTRFQGSRRRGFGILSATPAPSRGSFKSSDRNQNQPTTSTSTTTPRHLSLTTSTAPRQVGKFVIVDGFVVGTASPAKATTITTKEANPTTSPPTSRSVHIPSTTASYRLEEYVCEGVDDYIVPDQEYCDRYLSCPSSKVVLCLTNMVLDISTGVCKDKTAIDCTGRELLYRNVNQEDEQNKKLEEEMKEIMAPFQPSQVPDDDSKVETQFSSTCVVSRGEYVMADPVFCDRYMTCPEGEMEMCQRGMVLDQVTQLCMVREKVDCKGRERIYREEERSAKAKATNKAKEDISMSNEIPIPSAIHTNKETATGLIHKEGTKDEHQTRPEQEMSNFVFNTPTKTKTFASHGHSTTKTPVSSPSETRLNPAGSLSRKVKIMVDHRQTIPVNLLPSKSLEGTIDKTPAGSLPTLRKELDVLPTTAESPLPLSDSCGSQDQIPHPTDCKLFFTCDARGQKTLGSCDKPQVFNSVTGLCDVQENVPGCEGYYNNQVFKLDTVGREKIVKEIREQLIREFGLRRV